MSDQCGSIEGGDVQGRKAAIHENQSGCDGHWERLLGLHGGSGEIRADFFPGR